MASSDGRSSSIRWTQNSGWQSEETLTVPAQQQGRETSVLRRSPRSAAPYSHQAPASDLLIRSHGGGLDGPLGAFKCGFDFNRCSGSSQEIVFYKLIDYILHGKEDIKVIP